MTVWHYIDNEVAGFGEWDSTVASGTSAITQAADAAFPERGRAGIRTHLVNASLAYAQKLLAQEEPELSIGFWLRVPAMPTWSNGNIISLARAENDSLVSFVLYLRNESGSPVLRYHAYAGGGTATQQMSIPLTLGRWYYVALIVEWTSAHCRLDLYVDGVYEGTATKIADGVPHRPDRVGLGHWWSSAGTGGTFDFDEFRVGLGYLAPTAPRPATDLLSPERTVVPYRPSDANSRLFADYCAGQMGIPRVNLAPLPDASAVEELESYAQFQAQVENGIADYFSANPFVADNCMCFLLGYGLPGAFTHEQVKRSATSRLMNYGTAFSPQTPNPLYRPAPVGRLTKADMGGKFMAVRIDAADLDSAKALVDRCVAAGAMQAIPGANILYCDDGDYVGAVDCQRLRIATAPIGEFSSDAFVWGDTGSPQFDAPAGSRVCFADASENSACSLRSGDAACRTALTAGEYAAAVGTCQDAEEFDTRTFFEVLRVGGAFAEAVLAATAKLDGSAVAVGSPLMAVGFPKAGTDIYCGPGGIEDIDWQQPVACAKAGDDSVSVPSACDAGVRRAYVGRAVSPDGIEECGAAAVAYVEFDDQGQPLPAPLARPLDVTADALPDGNLLIGLSYAPPLGFAVADGFDVLSDGGTGQLDLDNPLASIDGSPGQSEVELAVPRPASAVRLAVRARAADRVGPISETIRVPAPCPPAAPERLEDTL